MRVVLLVPPTESSSVTVDKILNVWSHGVSSKLPSILSPVACAMAVAIEIACSSMSTVVTTAATVAS